MNRVRKRAWIMLVFLLVLVFGMGFFLYEYAAYSSQWVIHKGSPHVYENSSVGTGLIYDRDGTLLLDTTDGRTYAQDATLRQATLHWMGDRQGNIRANVLQEYVAQLTGFDLLNGVYAYAEADGEAELTISGRVQKAALKAMNGRKGTIAVYNYKTGQILCAVSTPTFDPDNVPNIAGDTSGIYEGVYMNRFTQATYPPGSIFKILTTAAALDAVEGIENMTFTCEGKYQLPGGRVTCERAHGTLNLKSAMANSCNCAYAQIALLLGGETLGEYVDRFGVTKDLSFDGMYAVKGNFQPETENQVALAWSAIGQHTDLINPCAWMTFMGAIGGGGTAAQPYLMERITLAGETTYQAETRMGERIMSEALAALLEEYMANNVTQIYGAGNFPGLTVCAKSGTSELGGGKVPNAMFSGFVADENYPLAFIVVVENGGYGAHTCVPILSAVLAECKAVLDGN